MDDTQKRGRGAVVGLLLSLLLSRSAMQLLVGPIYRLPGRMQSEIPHPGAGGLRWTAPRCDDKIPLLVREEDPEPFGRLTRMIRSLACLAALSLLAGGCLTVDEERVCDEGPAAADVQPVARQPVHVLRHVVLFRFNEGTRVADIRRIENAFGTLPGKIDVVYDFEWGTDVSVEDLQHGFTHCFVVSFLSEADRGKYLSHAAHQEFIELIEPYLAEVLVVDYWAN
jgi:hypothetical protein